MKKWLCILMVSIGSVALCACSGFESVEEVQKWDCSVMCAEKSNDSYVITYSDEKTISKTGIFSFQNQNEFAIVVHLLTDRQAERTSEIPAGGVSILYNIEKDKEYKVGCHADVEEETEIKLMVFDGERSEVYIK